MQSETYLCDRDDRDRVRERRRGSLKKGLFQKIHGLNVEILENLEILESPQSVENNGESDHLLGILENLDIIDSKFPPAQRRLFN